VVHLSCIVIVAEYYHSTTQESNY